MHLYHIKKMREHKDRWNVSGHQYDLEQYKYHAEKAIKNRGKKCPQMPKIIVTSKASGYQKKFGLVKN